MSGQFDYETMLRGQLKAELDGLANVAMSYHASLMQAASEKITSAQKHPLYPAAAFGGLGAFGIAGGIGLAAAATTTFPILLAGTAIASGVAMSGAAVAFLVAGLVDPSGAANAAMPSVKLAIDAISNPVSITLAPMAAGFDNDRGFETGIAVGQVATGVVHGLRGVSDLKTGGEQAGKNVFRAALSLAKGRASLAGSEGVLESEAAPKSGVSKEGLHLAPEINNANEEFKEEFERRQKKEAELNEQKRKKKEEADRAEESRKQQEKTAADAEARMKELDALLEQQRARARELEKQREREAERQRELDRLKAEVEKAEAKRREEERLAEEARKKAEEDRQRAEKSFYESHLLKYREDAERGYKGQLNFSDDSAQSGSDPGAEQPEGQTLDLQLPP